MNAPRIYLDHHASAPLADAARRAMVASLAAAAGNPSSLHREGRRARDLVEGARAAVAAAMGASPRGLTFTSGGTEALHLAVRGVGEANAVARVWCDPGAHPALRVACESLAKSRGLPFAWLPSTRGVVTYDAASDLGGALVAVSLVQHETGRIADLAGLVARARGAGAWVVVDAVQALGKIPVDAGQLGVSALAVSAHKIGGPPGVGALWVEPGVTLAPVLAGGGQERGLRGGTENVHGFVGFGAAAAEVSARLGVMERIAVQRDRIEHGLLSVDGVSASVTEASRVATVSHVAVEGCAGAELVAGFDLEGVAVSSTSACSSGRSEPSESLLRLYPEAPGRASSALRVSLGPGTTDAEVARFIALAPMVIARIRTAYSTTKRR